MNERKYVGVETSNVGLLKQMNQVIPTFMHMDQLIGWIIC